jgi:hypothetical protein
VGVRAASADDEPEGFRTPTKRYGLEDDGLASPSKASRAGQGGGGAMSRYRQAFEYLAERGTPAGATTLIDRVRRELVVSRSSVVAWVPDPGRSGFRLTGPVLALFAFLTILVIGIAATFLLPGAGSTDQARPPIPEVVWRKAPPEVVGTRAGAGPGGFVVAAPREVHVSADGIDWETLPLPEATAFPRYLGSTDTTWLLIMGDVISGDEPVAAWVSGDGRQWRRSELPEGLARRLGKVQLPGDFAGELRRGRGQIVSTPDAFLATVEDPFAEAEADLWLSSEGLEWDPIVAEGLPDEPLAFAGGPGGFLAWRHGDSGGSPLFYHSRDGRTWAPSETEPELVEQLTPSPPLLGMAMPDGSWLAHGLLQQADREPASSVWRSEDGRQWETLGAPDFDLQDDGQIAWILGTYRTQDALVALVHSASWSPGDEPFGSSPASLSAWVTRDGTHWERSHTFETVLAAAVAEIDGRLVGTWVAQDLGASQP